jgi:hypothetical protein
MTIKRNSLLVLSLLISVLFVSCWDNFEERTYYSANITSFSFAAQDTCPDIEDYTFNIDQYSGVVGDPTQGKIYNLDSLPYGSVVNSLYPTITFQSTNGNIYMNDSLWGSEDSIDFTSPVVLKNTSYDGTFTKRYTITVNVHQVDPDSMLLESISTVLPEAAESNKIIVTGDSILDFALVGGMLKVFITTDTCKTWTSLLVTGLPPTIHLQSICRFKSAYYVSSSTNQSYYSADGLLWSAHSPTLNGNPVGIQALYGEIPRKYLNDTITSALIGKLVTSSGDTCFGRSNDGLIWTVGSKVPDDFPVTDYALIEGHTATNVHFYTIACGLNKKGNFVKSVWSTEDGNNWVLIDNGSTYRTAAPLRKNPGLFFYDGYLVCFGGENQLGAYCKDLRISPDCGKTWKATPDYWEFFKMESGIAGAGAFVVRVPDTKNDLDREFIWIVGGTRSDGASDTIWKAFLNKMVFDRR